MKKVFHALTMLSTAPVYAQITITAANNLPNAGYTVTANLATSNIPSLGNPGANQTGI